MGSIWGASRYAKEREKETNRFAGSAVDLLILPPAGANTGSGPLRSELCRKDATQAGEIYCCNRNEQRD